MRKALVLLVAICSLTVACGSNSDKSSSETTSTIAKAAPIKLLFGDDQKPKTSDEALIVHDPKSSSLTKDQSLALFASQYGAIDGVAIPDTKGLPAGNESHGTYAVESMLDYWETLSPKQQTDIADKLELSVQEIAASRAASVPEKSGNDVATTVAASTTAPLDEKSGAEQSAKDANASTDVKGKVLERVPSRAEGDPNEDLELYERAVQLVLPAYESHLGPLTVQIDVRISQLTYNVPGFGPAAADTIVLGNRCRIRVFRRVFSPPIGVSESLAHEVGHCYQQSWRGPSETPDWVREGTADWMASQVVLDAGRGADERVLTSDMELYMNSPRVPLFQRSYDAFGWLLHASEQGANLWAAMRPANIASSNNVAYRALTIGTGAGLLDDWGSASVLERDFGPRWDIEARGVPIVFNGIELPDPPYPFGNGVGQVLNAPEYASERAYSSFTADVIRFTTAGATHGVLRIENGDHDINDLINDFQCTSPRNECVCPPDTAQAGRVFPRLGTGTAIYAVAGGGNGVSLSLQGLSLRDACGERQYCVVGTWDMTNRPNSLLWDTIQGGTGMQVRINEEAAVTMDWSRMQPWIAEPKGTNGQAGRFTVNFTGAATGRLDGIPDDPFTGPAPLLDMDYHGIGGSADMSLNGQVIMTIPPTEVGAMVGNGPTNTGTWSIASCADDRMTMQNSDVVYEFQRLPE